MIERKILNRDRIFSDLFLVICLIIGIILRFISLSSKPLWTDEIATLVFSSGNNYSSIPLNETISIEQILEPLKPNPLATVADVNSLLIAEDNHPPLYFILAHLWYRLFQDPARYISGGLGRSLAALFGVLSVPGMYWLGQYAFNSRRVACWAAWLMAVSPFGIYLAQEARHYTLGILWVIASLFCWLVAVKYLLAARVIPAWWILVWMAIDTLGWLTHYFFLITLTAEGLCLLFLLLVQIKRQKKFVGALSSNFWRVSGAFAAELILVSFWFLAVIPNDFGNGMTEWIETDPAIWLNLIGPFFQLLATLITMVSLLPVEASFLPLVILAAVLMLLFFLWFIPQIYQGFFRFNSQEKIAIKNLIFLFVVICLGIFWAVTYGLGMDITRGARYSFVYFPAVILFLSACLANVTSFGWASSQKTIWIVGLMGLLSALTVNVNLGYQKYYRPDLFVSLLESKSQAPILIATAHRTFVQTGEMMGIASLLADSGTTQNLSQAKFLLLHQNYPLDFLAREILEREISKIEKPLDLWLVNFESPVKLDACLPDANTSIPIDGYNYRLFHCS